MSAEQDTREALLTAEYWRWVDAGGNWKDPYSCFRAGAGAEVSRAALQAREAPALDHVECKNCGAYFFCQACDSTEPELHFREATREAPQPVAWRTEAAAWLRRKDAEGNTGWGNPGHWASVFAQQLEAEQEAAPFGYEPWEAPNKFGDRPTELGKALGRNLAQFTALAGEATREAPPAPEPLTDFQLDTLFSLAHEHGEFGRGFREAVRAALTSNKGEGQ
jgi:hypothetical protein